MARRTKKTSPAPSDRIEWISLTDITTDHRVNTREVDQGWVTRKLREGFDAGSVGVPIVSERSDGTYIWLDGQNRGELMRRSGWGSQKIQCRVYTDLTLQEEALTFLGLNDSRAVQPIHKFQALVTAEDPTVTKIVSILAQHGWAVSDQSRPGNMVAVRALQDICALDAHDDYLGGGILDRTLAVVTAAWGHDYAAANGNINRGIALVIHRSEQKVEAGNSVYAIDYPVLTDKLAKYPGGPHALWGAAGGLRRLINSTFADAVAHAVIQTYNVGRRKHHLPPWS